MITSLLIIVAVLILGCFCIWGIEDGLCYALVITLMASALFMLGSLALG
jgi:hypothetical protein